MCLFPEIWEDEPEKVIHVFSVVTDNILKLLLGIFSLNILALPE